MDLNTMAAQKQMSKEEIIQLHTSTTYRVYMIGFLPGFAYMGEVDEQIAFPRKAQPRTKVEAGSVGIAGIQTGIYPLDSPGGWQIIGKTPLKIFTKEKDDPVLLQPLIPKEKISFPTGRLIFSNQTSKKLKRA